jgi:hypothetical protein
MLTFRVRPDGYKEYRRKILLYSLPFYLISVGITFTITFTTSYDRNARVKPASDLYNTSSTFDWITWVVPIVFMAGAVCFGMFRGMRRVKKAYDSYELTISENLIAREQENTPTIAIYLTEVREIIKRRNKGFIVRGKTLNDMILIPAQIENYDQVEAALDKIKPVTTKGITTSALKLQVLLSLVAVGSMICVYSVENKIIVGTAAALFAAFYIYSFIQTQKSKNVDYKTKRIKWVLLLVVASVIGTAVMKLIN